MQCNIDARGRAVRLGLGMLMLMAAVVLLLVWAVPVGSLAAWVVTCAVGIAGAFAIYEGWAGWCAVRAMGYRTRL